MRFCPMFVCLLLSVPSATNAADAISEQAVKNEAWQATIKTAEVEFTDTYCFLSHGIIVEIQQHPNQRPTVSPGFFRFEKGRLSIDWTKVANRKLVQTSSESGTVTKDGDDILKYTIIQHTDKSQVGMEISFKRVQFDEAEFSKLLELADVYHRLREKELAEKELIDALQKQLSDQKDQLQRLLK